MRELLPTATGAQTWTVLRGLLRTRRRLAWTAVAVLLAGSTVGLGTARLLGMIVDLVATGHAADAIVLPAVLLVAVAIGQGAASAVGVAMVARLGEGMLADLREQFMERALRLPLETIERAGSGDLTARVTRDVSTVADSVRNALPVLARSAFTIVLTFVGLAVLDWRFLLPALLAVPIQWHTMRWYGNRALDVYARHRVAVGAQQQQLLETIGGASTVRAFRLADDHLGRVTDRSATAVGLSLDGTRLLSRFYARLNLAEFVGLAALLVTGFLLVRNGSATVGTATAAALYFHSLFNPINSALVLADDAQSAAASMSRLVGVIMLPAAPEPATVPAPTDASIRIAGLGHSYVDGYPVLSDIDLTLAAGERVALVGASGAGKTTLAKLIAGVHEPTHGTIHLGGVADARGQVALITQEVHVFAGTLVDDLRLAAPDATAEALHDALDTVGALEWALALPDGLSTVVGEGGHQLTAAQAQQLALARLVLADPPIAVLDEATADAGSAGARVLESAADQALKGRTALMVAHRLTQAAGADRVVVLESGRISESGAHADLLAANGTYAALWRAWSTHRS